MLLVFRVKVFTWHKIRHTVLSNISDPHLLFFFIFKTHFDDKWRLNRNNTKIRYFTPLILNVKPKISQEYCMEMSDEKLFTVLFKDFNLCRQPLHGSNVNSKM